MSLTRPATLTAVANIALGKIGSNTTLTNVETDTSSSALTVRLFLASVIAEVECSFRWPELVRRTTLETAAGQDSVSGRYYYALPDDYLRPASNEDNDNDYQVVNGYVYTDATEDFEFRYVRYSEDVTEWSALLLKCVYFCLALEICLPITENVPLFNALRDEYEKVVLPRAKLVGSFDHERPLSRRTRGTYSIARGARKIVRVRY